MISNKYIDSINNANGDPKRVASIARELKEKMSDGDPEAMITVSYLQLKGFVFEKKTKDAFRRLLNLVENRRDPDAAYVLGYCYYHGDYSLKRDINQAEKLLRIACSVKHGDAALMLADIYSNGEHYSVDAKEVERWLLLAHESGKVDATMMLGELYLSGGQSAFGDEIPVDFDKAVSYLKAASDMGENKANKLLALSYLSQAMMYVSSEGLDSDSDIIKIKDNLSVIEYLFFKK